MNYQKISLDGFCSLFNKKKDQKFGPLYDEPSYVLGQLAVHAQREFHKTKGMTVHEFADMLACNPYQASNEEICAVVRLFQLGWQDETIS